MKNKIIVLIPHYNDPEGLYKSLKSIVENEEVDVLIVDDGSQKRKIAEDKAQSFFRAKGKLYFHFLQENGGIETALNKGLEWVLQHEYEYIARLDSGDRNIGSRFIKQLEFLQKNQNIFLVGTWAKVVTETGDHLYDIKYPTDHEGIVKRMYRNNMFMHPSVMFRTESLKEVGFYPYQYPAAEDYAFFFKFIKKFETANIPELLLEYEINLNSISSKKRKLQVISRLRVIKDNFYVGYYPVLGLIRNLILLNFSRNTLEFIKKLSNWKGK